MTIILVLFFIAITIYVVYTDHLLKKQQQTIERLDELCDSRAKDFYKMVDNAEGAIEAYKLAKFNHELILSMVGIEISDDVNKTAKSIEQAMVRAGYDPNSISERGREIVLEAHEKGLISDEMMKSYMVMESR